MDEAALGAEVRELHPFVIAGGGIALGVGTAVSDSGQIVCAGQNAQSDVVSFILSPVLGIAGDTNCDGVVNIDDLLKVIQWWGPGPSHADLNGDQIVNLVDLLIVIDNWGF